MGAYKNFQTDNAKYTKKTSRDSITNPDFNPTVSTVGKTQGVAFEENLDKYEELLFLILWFPDLFLDLIKPEFGGIALNTSQREFLRAESRFQSMYGVYNRGYSKCITGDSLLFTKEGIKEIGEYFNYKQINHEEWLDDTGTNISVINRYGKEETVSSLFNGGYKSTKKIATEFGYNIQGTANHPVLTVSNSGQVDWKPLGELSVGDYVAVNRKNNIWGNKTDIDFTLEMNQWVDNLSQCSKSHLQYKSLPKQLNTDIALLMGYLVGDGCMALSQSIIFSNIDEDILNNFKNIFHKEFQCNVKKRSGDNCDYIVYNKFVRKYFEFLGLGYEKAHGKTVPQLIMDSTPENVSAFLQGLFDTDGTVNKRNINLCTVSHKMAKQVHMCLLNFGIISKVKKRIGTLGNEYYLVIIMGENMKIFSDKIGFGCQRKQKILNINVIKKFNTNKDIIPFQNTIIQQMYGHIKKANPKIYSRLSHLIQNNNNLTYNKLNLILGLNSIQDSSWYDHLQMLQDTNYFYTKIISIENTEDYVYDLSLPQTHSFVSNGLISHNTFLEVALMFIHCCVRPGLELSLTAQTQENAANLLKDKYLDLTKKYPWFKNEIYKTNFSKDSALIEFNNGAQITNLANSKSSKGLRRHGLRIEESDLLDNEVFLKCLEPIPSEPRMSGGRLSIKDPYELHHKIDFFTTSGFRNTAEYQRNILMLDGMSNLDGSFVIGSDWKLGCWYGRGESRVSILKKKASQPYAIFARNYGSEWVGTVEGALVDMVKFYATRTLKEAVSEPDDKFEYFLGVDVARSQNSSNNSSLVAVLEVHRTKNGKIEAVHVVNLVKVSAQLDFDGQAIEVKRIFNQYNAVAVCVDGNGLGVGLVDALMHTHEDPVTRKTLYAYDSINTNATPDDPDNAKPCLYDLKAQSKMNEIIVSFISYVEGDKLRTLVDSSTKDDSTQSKIKYSKDVLPFWETDLLMIEVSNLKIKHVNQAKLSVEQVMKADKDRYSAVSYGLWFIDEYYKDAGDDDEYDYSFRSS